MSQLIVTALKKEKNLKLHLETNVETSCMFQMQLMQLSNQY